MANRRRGEVPLELGGERYTLCFTLGALAELEDALRAGDVAGLGERLGAGRLGARDLIALLGAALRGGGHTINDAGVGRLPIAGGLEAVTDALGAALAAAFGEGPAENPMVPRRA
ncbi:gene transfer agent family protein [Methylobacterium sp. NEAU 140]|uniref:gene transfer agent family protein n=1 Tax=Methylobacterium sp. NEAU 140 TaxID=3064945 RepID=UPI00273309E4|nr:gene transfer agent family protein [Methylobacterium sp. NEAU 140]MDP4021409.1 gene transfer agent family protein [Methylobacterium sp. NEAU 140]